MLCQRVNPGRLHRGGRPSAPLKFAFDRGLVQFPAVDWGAGDGSDLRRLRRTGQSSGYDPETMPARPRGKFKYGQLVYVLNTVPSGRAKILREFKARLRPGASWLVAVRGEAEIEREARAGGWRRAGDGWRSPGGAFQKGYGRRGLAAALSRAGFRDFEIEQLGGSLLAYSGAERENPRNKQNAKFYAHLELLGYPPPAKIPNLKDYNYIVINTSGGKDSQALLDYVVELADQAGVRERLIAVHADLGRVEWAGTKELAEEQALSYGLRFVTVERDLGDLLCQIEQRGMFPDSQNRYCTSDQKTSQVHKLFVRLNAESNAEYLKKVDVEPIKARFVAERIADTRTRRLKIKTLKRGKLTKSQKKKFQESRLSIGEFLAAEVEKLQAAPMTNRELAKIARLQRGELNRGENNDLGVRVRDTTPVVRIISALGIRGEESSARFERYKDDQLQIESKPTGEGSEKIVERWLPIFWWLEGERGDTDPYTVWGRIHQAGTRSHKAYDLGMSRLSCVFCVFASKRDLLIAGEQNPELLKEYVDVEQKIGHTFRQDLSLASLSAEVEKGRAAGIKFARVLPIVASSDQPFYDPGAQMGLFDQLGSARQNPTEDVQVVFPESWPESTKAFMDAVLARQPLDNPAPYVVSRNPASIDIQSEAPPDAIPLEDLPREVREHPSFEKAKKQMLARYGKEPDHAIPVSVSPGASPVLAAIGELKSTSYIAADAAGEPLDHWIHASGDQGSGKRRTRPQILASDPIHKDILLASPPGAQSEFTARGVKG